ncbi:hypothetical protein V0M98_32280 (plasmid) [Pseudomonas silesiensis]|uniref:hypothetical protein n=1 Tax=Pseudomonas silesiensis TaxID=1853130 RepID=UPI0030D1CA75
MSSTMRCEIPIQDGFEKPDIAVFNSACIMLIVEERSTESLPLTFVVEVEGDPFNVLKVGDDYVVHDDQKDAFTALVFG